MSITTALSNTTRRSLGKGLAWAQVNHPGAVAKAIQFAISRKSSSKKHGGEKPAQPKAVGLQAASQAARIPQPLVLTRTSGIRAASAIAAVTPEQAQALG